MTPRVRTRLAPLLLVIALAVPAAPLGPATSSALSSPSATTPTGWTQPPGDWTCHAASGPACRQTLNGVEMLSEDEGWAVGEKGTLLHLSGGHWQAVEVGQVGPLTDIDFASPVEGWAVGYESLLHYSAGSWSVLPSPGGNVIEAVDLVSADEGWAVGWQSTILHLSTGVWQRVAAPPTRGYFTLKDVVMLSPDEGWAVGEEVIPEGEPPYNDARRPVVLRYNDGAWHLAPLPFEEDVLFSLNAVAVVSPDEVWAAGSSSLLHYKDGTWELVPTSGSVFHAITMVSADEGWAVGERFITLEAERPRFGETALLMHYSDGAWQEVPLGFNQALLSLDMTSPGDGRAVGEYGLMLRYREGAWQIEGLPPTDVLNDVEMLSPVEGWAVGGDESDLASAIWHFHNGTWQPEQSPAGFQLNAVDMLSTEDGWAVGNHGTIVYYDGKSWQLVPSPTSDSLQDIDMLSPDLGWAVGGTWERSTVLKYSGGRWQFVAAPNYGEMRALQMVSPEEAWIGNGGSLVHYISGTWERLFNHYGVGALDMIAPNEGWLVSGSAVQHFHNRRFELESIGHSANSNLMDIDMLSRVEGWAVGESGGLLHRPGPGSDEPWNPYLQSPTDLDLHSVAMLSPGEGWAVGEGGVILHYLTPAAPADAVTIAGPTVGFIDTPMRLVATITPMTATLPVTYTWELPGQPPLVRVGAVRDEQTFTTAITGSHTVTVTASTPLGGVRDTHTIWIVQGQRVLLPNVKRAP